MVLAVGGAASVSFSLVGIPSPVLFGALAGGLVHALAAEQPVDMAPWLFRLGQSLVGATIGALVDLPTLSRLGGDWPSVLVVTTGTLMISLLAGRLLATRHDVTVTTGVFAMVAGGASGIVALSRELGADDRVVTVVQYLRVLLVLMAMPVVTALLFHPPTGLGTLAQPTTRWGADLTFVAVAVGAGMLLTSVVRAPAMALLGPMMIAVVFSASGVLGEVSVPGVVESLGFALIGVRVGLRFTRASLVAIGRLLPLALTLMTLLIAGCAGLGLLLSAVTGVDRLTAYLATTPGGLFAVLATAADSGSDVTYVLAIQVIRLFAMLLVAPLLARLLRLRRSDLGNA